MKVWSFLKGNDTVLDITKNERRIHQNKSKVQYKGYNEKQLQFIIIG